jgi:hypothetical protein
MLSHRAGHGNHGAGNETRTRDLNLGKITLQIIQAFDLDKNYAFDGSRTGALRARMELLR